MGREPRSHQRPVALAGIHVSFTVNVLVVRMDDRLAVKPLVVIQRVVCSESIRVDRQWLLLAAREKEPNRRFVRRFRRNDVPLPAPAINEGEHRQFVTLIGSTPARGETSRARRAVALAALESGRNVQFVDLDGTGQFDRRRVERFGEALDTPVKRLVREVEFSGKLADTGVEPDEGIEREEPLVERDLRVREDRAGLVVEGAVTILTEIPLKGSVAAVLDHRRRTAARALEAIAPADLLEQVRGARLRTQCGEWKHPTG